MLFTLRTFGILKRVSLYVFLVSLQWNSPKAKCPALSPPSAIMSTRRLICAAAPQCPTPLCYFDLAAGVVDSTHANTHIHPNTAMLLCSCVVACFQMAASHVSVDEWMLTMFECAALLVWFEYKRWQSMLRVIIYTWIIKNLLYLQSVCMHVCVSVYVCVFGAALWSTGSSVNNHQHHLQVSTLTPTPSSAGFRWVSFPFLNKTQKRTAMFTVSAQATVESRPGLGGPPPLHTLSVLSSHSSHLCWGLAGRKI